MTDKLHWTSRGTAYASKGNVVRPRIGWNGPRIRPIDFGRVDFAADEPVDQSRLPNNVDAAFASPRKKRFVPDLG